MDAWATGRRPGLRVLPDGHSELIARLAVGEAGIRVEPATACGPTDRPELFPAPPAAAAGRGGGLQV